MSADPNADPKADPTVRRAQRTPEEILRAAGVIFAVHEHEPVRTFAEGVERLPFPAEAMVKTLAAETGGELVLVALRGADRLHFGKLARALGVGRDTLNAVTPAGLEVELGFEVGAVSLLTDFPAARLVDEAVLGLGTVFTGSGRADRTIEVAVADLVRASGALPAGLVGPPPPRGDDPSQ